MGTHGSPPASVWEGMEVQTNSPDIRQARRISSSCLIDNHPMDCQTCDPRPGIASCRIWPTRWACGGDFEASGSGFPWNSPAAASSATPRSASSAAAAYACAAEIQGVHNLSQHGRGFRTVVGPAHLSNMDDSVCIQCGQCINVCPTAAFVENRGRRRLGRAGNPQITW